jgi:hypothetical protein
LPDKSSRLEREFAAPKLTAMKPAFLLLSALAIMLAAPSSEARSINDIPAAKEALLRIVSPKFYRSLLISPVQGWVVVRGSLMNDHLAGARVVRSDLDASYDRMALELANNLQIVDYTRVDRSSRAAPAVLVHLLVYKIADGTMAMSFAQFDGAGGNQLRYSGAAWMAVLKGNDWVTIEPRQLTPHERRGPRMYTLAVEGANSARSLQGNGRPSIAQASVQGGSMPVIHTVPVR